MEIQIFIGIHCTQQIKQLYSLKNFHPLCIENHYQKDYLGFFIPSNTITFEYLKQQKQILISQLMSLFNQPKSLWPKLSFAIFPKAVLGNFHKYNPNPG